MLRRLSQTPHVLSPRRAIGRLLLASTFGLCVTWLAARLFSAWTLRALVGWDAAAALMLVQSWAILATSSAETTERRAAEEDPGAAAVLVIAVLSSLFSLFAATLSLREAREHPGNDGL